MALEQPLTKCRTSPQRGPTGQLRGGHATRERSGAKSKKPAASFRMLSSFLVGHNKSRQTHRLPILFKTSSRCGDSCFAK